MYRLHPEEDGGDTLLWNVGSYKIYTAPHPRRQHSSFFVFSYKSDNEKMCGGWYGSTRS
jgi:hypothetical protein